jgi:hypothetical protein
MRSSSSPPVRDLLLAAAIIKDSNWISINNLIRPIFKSDVPSELYWRYPDLTSRTEYIGEVVRLTTEGKMSKEASYLRYMSGPGRQRTEARRQ